MAVVDSSRSKAASRNSGGGAIETVGYSGQESSSRTVKTTLGLEQVGWNSWTI